MATDAGRDPLDRATCAMWNSGVIGVDAADRALVDRALAACDAIYPRIRSSNVEQFSLGLVLGHDARLAEAAPLVEHDWPDWVDPYLQTSVRRLMHAEIRRFFGTTEGLDFAAMLDRFGRFRLRPFRRPLPVRVLARFCSPELVRRVLPPRWRELGPA